MADTRQAKLALQRKASIAMNRAVGQTRDETRRAAPHRTGALGESITVTPALPNGGRYQSVISTDDRKAVMMDDGTRSHLIRPKGPGYPLRFMWPRPKGPGAVVYFTQTNHPGTPAYRFFRVPMPERFRRALRRAWDEVS